MRLQTRRDMAPARLCLLANLLERNNAFFRPLVTLEIAVLDGLKISPVVERLALLGTAREQ